MKQNIFAALFPFLICGCVSTQLAIDTQERCNAVAEQIVQNYDEGLRLYLFKATDYVIAEAARESNPLKAEQALNAYANQLDLVKFWAIQWEKCKTLRLVGVTSKLVESQSIVELLFKRVTLAIDKTSLPAPAPATSQPVTP